MQNVLSPSNTYSNIEKGRVQISWGQLSSNARYKVKYVEFYILNNELSLIEFKYVEFRIELSLRREKKSTWLNLSLELQVELSSSLAMYQSIRCNAPLNTFWYNVAGILVLGKLSTWIGKNNGVKTLRHDNTLFKELFAPKFC